MGDVCVCVCASDYVGQAPALNTHLHFLSSFYLNFCFSWNFDDFQLSIPSSAFSESINSTWVKGKCPTWKPKTKTCKHNFFSSYYFYKFVADKRADCPAETWIARPPADKTSSEKYKKTTDLAVKFAFPLSVDMHFGHLDSVAHLETQGRLVVCVRYACLLHSGVRGQLAL